VKNFINEYTVDNPRVRCGFTCPLCYGPKDAGLVVCWPCHRNQELENDGCYSEDAETTIAEFENFLASQERRT
jgi:hypothetical protein